MTSGAETIDGQLRDGAERFRRVASDDPIAREVARAKLFGSPAPRIGRYLVRGLLGAGGMGVVYRAHDEELDRDVALKMLSGGGELRDARLQREAQALAKLSHPNVVQVFDFGHAFGRFFLAMELVDGPTLRQWQRGRSRDEIVRAYVEAGHGIAAAHAMGLLHLDLKPDNILVGSDGRARVADFGLVAALPTEDSDDDTTRSDSPTSTLAGTPVYMSPEQVRREPLDARSDVFSFCVAMFESLTGARPFVDGTFRVQRRSSLPRRLDRVLRRGLALDPSDRFGSMLELLAALAARPSAAWLLAATAAIVPLAYLSTTARTDDARATACDDVATIDEIWNEEIARQIATGFETAQPTWGSSAWPSVDAGLRSHADAWGRARDEICSAEQPNEIAVGCLARDRERFAVLVDHFARADARVVERAADLVDDLPSPRTCMEVTVAPVTTTDPHTRAEDLAIDRRLAQLSARVDVGRAKTLDAEAESLVAEALARTDAGVRARAWLLRATLLDRELRHREAADALESAFFVASEAGLVEETVHAATMLVGVHGVELGEPARGLEWAEHSTAAIERMGIDPRGVWGLRFARIAVLTAANRLDEAEADVREGLATLERLDEPERSAAEQRLQAGLANVLLARGRMPEAERAWLRAVELTRALRGAEHPDVASPLLNLATTRAEQGRDAEAEADMREAARLWTRAYGPDNARLSAVMNNLANTVDDLDEALALAQDALRIGTKNGFAPPKLSELHHTLGSIHRRRGDLDLAARHFGEERALLEATLGPDHPDLGHALNSLARVEATRGRHAEARPLYEAALKLWRTAYGDDHMLLAYPLSGLGEVDLAEGRPDAAVPSLRAAIALWIAHPGEPRKLAQARFALARALWHRTDDRVEARELAGEARKTFVEGGANDAAQLAELDAWRRDHR